MNINQKKKLYIYIIINRKKYKILKKILKKKKNSIKITK